MRALIAVLSLAMLAPPPALAYIPEQTPRRNAEASVQRILGEPAVRGTRAGFVVVRGGRLIVGHRAEEPFVPASLMKLATTTAAIMRFGPEHRFVTRVVREGDGDVLERAWLVGGGDPTLATVAYRQRRFLPDPTDRIQRPAFASGSPTVEDLADAIAATGVRRIRVLLADESLFDDRRTQPGWRSSYLDSDPDVSYLSALAVNEARAGADRKTLVADPAVHAARTLATALRERNVSVGSVARGTAPDGAPEVARVASPPLAEIVDFINRYSVNYPAELLMKSLGAAATGLGTTIAGEAEVRRILGDLGIPLRGFVMADGSGLSLRDRMSPRTVAAILERIESGRGARWRALASSIPVAGGPGTLLNRMTGPPTGGNLRGKTGQVREVRAMAGWVRAADGVPLVYTAIVNETPSPFSLTGPLDLLGLLLARFPTA